VWVGEREREREELQVVVCICTVTSRLGVAEGVFYNGIERERDWEFGAEQCL
jgi:hypothetical protein